MAPIRAARRRVTPADLVLSVATVPLVMSFLSMRGKSLLDRNWSYRMQHAVAAAFFGVLLAVTALALTRRYEVRRNAATLVVAFVVGVAGVELALSWFPALSDTRVRAAVRAGAVFDRRPKIEVIMDARAAGERLYPSVHPFMFLGQPLNVSGTPTLPLGGLASTPTVLCNESGRYTTFTSDEAGFHNPPIGWTQLSELEVVVVGDSVAEGSCVADGEGFVARLQREFPKTVNLASSGNGPLLELAVIREYLDGRKARFVIWTYFERNDLMELVRERGNPFLEKYLAGGFSQRLVERQTEVQHALTAFVDANLAAEQEGREREKSRPGVEFNVFSLLPNMKQLLLRAWTVYEERRDGPGPAEEASLDLYSRILQEAAASVQAAGGQLLFLSLPEFGRYGGVPSSGARARQAVLAMARRGGIDVVDIEVEFSGTGDPESLFPFRLDGHYNEAGNRVVAEAVGRALRTRGLIPGGRQVADQSVGQP